MSDTSELARVITEHGMLVLVPLSILEGPIVAIVAGWLVSLSLLNPWTVFLVVLFGDVAGDLLVYAGGRGLRLNRLPVVGRWLTLPMPKVRPYIKKLRRHAFRVLFMAKITHFAGFPVLYAAGVARVPLRTFIIANFLAAIPKSLLLLGIGHAFGAAHAQLSNWLSYASYGALALAVPLALGWYLYRRRHDRRSMSL